MRDIGQRIVVLGVTGSGKSTLARKLSEMYKFKCIELDNLFWKPNWEMSDDDEFARSVKEAIASECWVVDGNYTRSAAPIVWGQADTLIWLDYPLRINLWRIWKRTWSRFLRREALWEAGNKENLWKHFFTRDSLFLYAWESHPKKQQQYSEIFASPEYANYRRIRLTSPKATAQWLENLKSEIH